MLGSINNRIIYFVIFLLYTQKSSKRFKSYKLLLIKIKKVTSTSYLFHYPGQTIAFLYLFLLFSPLWGEELLQLYKNFRTYPSNLSRNRHLFQHRIIST
jgi:hypothetical protein